MPRKPNYVACRLIVKPPFDVSVVRKFAAPRGFEVAELTADGDDDEKAGDLVLTANEAAQPRMEERIAELANLLRHSGHAPNVGRYTIRSLGV